MNLIIAGSRHLRVSYNFLKSKLVFFEIPLEAIEEFIGGEAPGIDHCAKMFALKLGKTYRGFPYKSELGKAGGPVRNQEMADYANREGRGALLLIWDGVSRGSSNMKFEARKRGLPIFEVILHQPTQADRKKLGIYVDPKDRKSTINRSNKPQQELHPGVTV